jgi:hypothetical protein
MLAVQRVVSKQLRVPSDAKSVDDVKKYVAGLIDSEYTAVARDQRLRNPDKIAAFIDIAEIARASALSYFEVRRAIEHHGGRTAKDVTLRFARLRLMVGDQEISKPGVVVGEGQSVGLSMNHESRVLRANEPIWIGESELEHIMFTIQHLIGPEVQRVINGKRA